MAHHHDHGHTHGAGNERRVFWVMLLTGGFMVVEVAGGLISGSLALLADAGHMLTDTLALSLAWLGFLAGRKAADIHRTYGYRRFEVLAAWVNGVALLGLTVWIVIEAFQRLVEPEPVMGEAMLGVATVGLVVNIAALRILHQGEDENLNMRAASLHVLGDLLGSVGAIIAAIIILLTGWTPADPILSVFVAVLILRSAWMLVKKSTHILLEGTPEGLDVDDMCQAIREGHPEVLDVHHVHAWSLTSGEALVTFHVRLSEGAEPDPVLVDIKHRLAEDFDVHHSVVQLEATDCPDDHPRARC